jgi:DNA-binding XRE family transcriptional regulator
MPADSPLASDPVQPTGTRIATTTHGRFEVPEYPVDTVAVGDQIRDVRVGKGLTLNEAARLAGLPPRTLSEIEHGKARLRDTRAALLELCRAWKVTA